MVTTLLLLLVPHLILTDPISALPSHQTAPKLQQDHVFFRNVGTTVPTLSYVHVAFDLDLKSIASNLNTLKIAIDREQTFFQSFQLTRAQWLSEDAPPHLRRHEEKQAELFQRMAESQWLTMFNQANTIQKLMDDINLVLALGLPTKTPVLHHNPHPAFNDSIHRPKRFAFTTLALGITAVASSLFGIFTQGQIHSMQSEIRTLGDVQHKIVSVLENNTLHLDQLQDEMNRLTTDVQTWTIFQQFMLKSEAIDSAITAAAEDVHAVEAIVDAMMKNQISLKMFKQQTLEQVLAAVTVKAVKFGYVPLLAHFSDFLQCDASFVFNDAGFTVMLHVPAHLSNTALVILEHVPFPIRVHDQLFAEISTEFKFLGIHRDSRHFAIFTETELQACNQRGTAFLCKNHNILKKYDPDAVKRDPATCLYALYLQDYATILRTCDTHIRPSSDKVIQYNEHTFWTYTASPHQGEIHCPDKKPRRFSADYTAEVTLPTGCTAATKSHMFTAGANLATTHWEYHWGWPKLALANLTADIDLDGYAQLLHNAHPRARHRIPSEISIIKEELSQLTSTPSSRWMAAKENVLLKIVIGIIGLMASGVTLYIVISILRRRCRNRNRPEGSASARIGEAGVQVFLNPSNPNPNPSAPTYPNLDQPTPRLPF